MSNPALWTIYAQARHQEMLEEAEKARRFRFVKTAAPKQKHHGRIRTSYWLKPRLNPTMIK